MVAAAIESASLLIGSNSGFSVLPKDISTCHQEEPGLELPTLPSLDNLLYLLTYSHPSSQLTCVHPQPYAPAPQSPSLSMTVEWELSPWCSCLFVLVNAYALMSITCVFCRQQTGWSDCQLFKMSVLMSQKNKHIFSPTLFRLLKRLTSWLWMKSWMT